MRKNNIQIVGIEVREGHCRYQTSMGWLSCWLEPINYELRGLVNCTVDIEVEEKVSQNNGKTYKNIIQFYGISDPNAVIQPTIQSPRVTERPTASFRGTNQMVNSNMKLAGKQDATHRNCMIMQSIEMFKTLIKKDEDTSFKDLMTTSIELVKQVEENFQ